MAGCALADEGQFLQGSRHAPKRAPHHEDAGFNPALRMSFDHGEH
jgi:hypothetical protein